MGQQELKIRATADGTEEVARKLDAISAAQERVKRGSAGGGITNPFAGTIFGSDTVDAGDPGEAIEGVADAQAKLNASTEDYTALLSRVHPLLGGMFDAMVKGSKVAGDLATKEFELKKITQGLSGAVAENANVLKLLGAGGVAAIGFTALAKSISFVVEESGRLREELAQLKGEATEEQRDVMAQQRDVVAASAQRREGQFDAGEAKQAAEDLAGILRRGRVEQDEIGNLKELVASLSGLVSAQDIEKLAIGGFTVDAGRSAGSRKALAERALRRPRTAEEFAKQTERQRARRVAQSRAAFDEATSDDPLQGAANIEDRASRSSVLGDEKIVAAIVRRVLKNQRENPPARFDLDDAVSNAAEELFREREGTGFFGGLGRDFFGADPNQFEQNDAKRVVRDLLNQERGGAGVQPVTVNITENNARHNGADAAARRKRSVNGSSILAGLRAGM